MNNHHITEKVLKKIEGEGLIPLSKKYFTFYNMIMWFLAGLTLVLGALFFSSIIFHLSNLSRMLPPFQDDFLLYDFVRLFPSLWIICFSLFATLAYKEIRKTKQGYRYEFSTLILSMILFCVIFGVILYCLGSGYFLDRFVSNHVPFHKNVERIQKEGWFSPEKGFLLGEVLEETEEGFSLQDPEHTEWEILFDPKIDPKEKTFVIKGKKLGIHGELIEAEAHVFIACKIKLLDLDGRGKFVPMLPVSKMKNERKMMISRTNVCEGVRPLVN